MSCRAVVAAIGATLLFLSACGGGTDAPVIARIVIVPGTQTLLSTGAMVQLTATAVATDGTTIPGVGFSWSSLDPAVTVSASGVVTAVENGTGRVVASAESKADTAEISVFVSACGETVPALSLAIGAMHELATPEERDELCLAGAGAEFVLMPFFANAVSSATVQFRLEPNGVENPSGPPNPSRAPLIDVSSLLSPAGLHDPLPDGAFEHELRERERRELTGTHRLAARQQRASGLQRDLLATAPALGDELLLNVNSSSTCQTPDLRTGRVAAISQHAVIVHDVDNPANGFTDAEYASIAVTFDTLVYPLAVDAFGGESDIDANGRVVIFYTRAVNQLTPQGSGSFVGGFFFGRDLFPKSGTSPCPGSNEAEMFYMLVPDPGGVVNGNQRTKDFVNRVTVGTIAHELQHLINASRRVFVTNAPPEEVWLNEGLSHIAEELTFYRSASLQPRSNIALSLLTQEENVNRAVNAFQTPNLGRLLRYLEATESNSPFASNDQLGTRGAAWQLLRYVADRTRPLDGDFWFRLVNSTTTGLANLSGVAGTDALPLVGDFTIAQYTDDTGIGVPAFQHLSWHFRDVLPALNNDNPALRVRFLVNGSINAVTLTGGGAAYIRFRVPSSFGVIRSSAGGAPIPATVRMTLVRTK
ncbi:MAG TPA: hypothetical protein VJ803_13120 [Gemmatimonadaceae bacterium]|nr:hypothetical protein [Gemmatimonadaceae bacterium]